MHRRRPFWLLRVVESLSRRRAHGAIDDRLKRASPFYSLRVADLLEVRERGVRFGAGSLLPFAERAVRQRFVVFVAHAALPKRPCSTFLSFARIASSMSAHCCIIFVRWG